MKIALKRKIRIRSSYDGIVNAMFFLYLCIPFIETVFARLLSVFDLSQYALAATLLPIYAMYFVLCIYKKRLLVLDFWVLLLFVICFFSITIMVHPEYQHWYERPDYGVINYVLRPDNGIFIYLLIRLIDNPKKMMKTIKASAWIMFALYGRTVIQAVHRGYWIDTTNRGVEMHMSYNLSLGYNVLLFVLPFLYSALKDKSLSGIIGSAIGISIILVGGSRGPFLDLGIFIIIYVLLRIQNSRNKILIISGVVLLFAALYLVYPYLLMLLSTVFKRAGLTSRFISTLASGAITEGSGRERIWHAAVEMIKSNPLGYGAMGSRHVMQEFIYVAHPHQVFLEMLIDFGVIIGSIIIVWLLVSSVRMFTMKGQDEWKAVFLVFFARACQLLVSVTFWHSIGLWGVLAVGVNMSRASKRGKRHG